MRAAPSVEVFVSRFGVWHGVLWSLGSTSMASLAAWLLHRATPAGPWLWCVAVVAGMLSASMMIAVRRASRPFVLRWDSQHWSIAIDDSVDGVKAHRSPVTNVTRDGQPGRFSFERSRQGDLSVVIDLGSWMLLRFDPPHFSHNSEAANAPTDVNLHNADPTSRSAARRLWLPLQRSGLEPQWHALRCAVHSRAASNLEASRLLNTRTSA